MLSSNVNSKKEIRLPIVQFYSEINKKFEEKRQDPILEYIDKQNKYMSGTEDLTTVHVASNQVSQINLSKYRIQCWGSIRIYKIPTPFPNKATKNACQTNSTGDFKYSHKNCNYYVIQFVECILHFHQKRD